MESTRSRILTAIGMMVEAAENRTKTIDKITHDEADEIRFAANRITTDLRGAMFAMLLDQYSIAEYLVFLRREEQPYASLHFIVMLYVACGRLPPPGLFEHINAPVKMDEFIDAILESLMASLENDLSEVQKWM